MKKNVFGRKFKRDVNQRKALFKSLMSSLVLKERIKTTLAKAKAIKADVDKLITRVKKGEDEARRLLGKSLSQDALEKLITKVAPRFKERSGGYTRIIRLGRRVSDHASMVIMEWVEKEIVDVVEKEPARRSLGEGGEKSVGKKEKKAIKKKSTVKTSSATKVSKDRSAGKKKAKPKTKAKSKVKK